MRIRLIAIDLDGTLLRKDGTISLKTQEAVIAAMEKGILVVPATGRSFRNTRWLLQDFPEFSYYLNANGTVLTEGKTSKILHVHEILPKTARALYQCCEKYPCFIELYHAQDAYNNADGCAYLKNLMDMYCAQLLETNYQMEDLGSFVETHALSKFHVVCAHRQDKQKLMDDMTQLPNIFPISTESNNLEVVYGHYSKREGLRQLCEMLGIKREEVLAIGDSDNDREMLEWAGIGAAMGNAPEHIRDIADWVTEDNEHDGVAKVLKSVI